MQLLFDIGASQMRLATTLDGTTFTPPKIIPTPPGGAPAVLEELANFIAGSANSLEGVVGGVTKKIALDSAQLTDRFQVPAVVENDTALVGLGEAVTGAGQEAKIVAYFTVSTGVGGVRIVNRQIDVNQQGFEPGHQIINYLEPDKRFEDYVSGRALAERLGVPPKTITDPQFWQDLSQIVGYGLYNSILHWSPELVVLGGGMFGTPGLDIAVIEATVRQVLKIFPTCPPFRRATLGEWGGLHGALELLRRL